MSEQDTPKPKEKITKKEVDEFAKAINNPDHDALEGLVRSLNKMREQGVDYEGPTSKQNLDQERASKVSKKGKG